MSGRPSVLYAAEQLILPDADAPLPGWIEVDADRIVACGSGEAPRPADETLNGLAAPGFVDVHCHGGGGASFSSRSDSEVATALAAHRTHGSTSIVASLVSGSIDDLEAQVRHLVGLVRAGELAGIHLEGPWLARAYKGAHDADVLADPDATSVQRLLDAGEGTVRMATIAPERAGGLEAVRQVTAAGCVAAIGHTAADYETVRAAVEAGARGATHLFNAMPPLKHREPGPVLALWEDDRVTIELVLDGIHVQPDLVAFVCRTAPGRVALITDAMAAAASEDGDYMLGPVAVEVRGGVARLAGADTIAGSTLTMDAALARAVATGVPLVDAVRCVTSTPADYLGLDGVGRITSGAFADLVVLDENLGVGRVMRRGRWL